MRVRVESWDQKCDTDEVSRGGSVDDVVAMYIVSTSGDGMSAHDFWNEGTDDVDTGRITATVEVWSEGFVLEESCQLLHTTLVGSAWCWYQCMLGGRLAWLTVFE